MTHLPSGMDPRRADNVLTWLSDRRLVHPDSVHEAPEIGWTDLRRVHTEAWLDSLDDPTVVGQVVGLPPDRLPVGSLLSLWRRGVGATVEAARYALAHRVRTATTMGGFHHAGPDRGVGFCALNDIAVAAAALRADGFRGRIAVVDVDAHPPDGLAAFDLDLEIRSLGVESSWTTDLPHDVRVPQKSTDDVYLAALDRLLDGLKCDLAFVIAGSDPLVGDPLGSLSISEKGLIARDERLFAALGDTPAVVTPGGGYTRRSWRVYAHSLAIAAKSHQRVPENYDPVVRRAGQVARTFPQLGDEPLLTEADVAELFGRPAERRFLGHFTRHRVEFALEQYGLLGALTRLGFGPLEVSITTGESPERVRVLGQFAGESTCLVDLAVSQSRVDRFDLLNIDWLELVDPRTPAGLPGQRRGGLGVASEIASILGVTAKRIGMDGIAFVPSHYHVAYIARNRARFVDPKVQGRFEAMLRFLDGVPLAVASRLVAEGLPTEDGQPLVWNPQPMVAALDPAMEASLEAGEEEARAVRRGTLLRLLELSLVWPSAR